MWSFSFIGHVYFQPLGSSAARPSYLKTGSPVLDSSHADRSKAFDLDVYWKEFQQVRESATQTEADEPEEQLIPTPGRLKSCINYNVCRLFSSVV